ncbi:hypothetical protein Taro_010171 [Colocasia esculenta]|uniref:Uncharacterized protein n=1 Tax=Colocasia esculenta TaxID=4460 RepID=A0A843UC85_COLES|nr:hypothetical protein [Colocasia esculenta]
MPQAMEVEVDDDGEFLAVARYDNALVAHLLICLSCSKTCVPWPQQLPESLSPTWGRRKVRSGAPVALEGAKREKEVGGASPATPLSWSGTSGTSGSRSDDGWSTPLRSPKRRQQQQRPKRGGAHEDEERGWPPRPLSMQGSEVCHGGGEQVDAPPAKGTVPEWSRRGCHSGGDEGASPSKVGRVRATIETSCRGQGGANWMVVGRRGKKTTVLELRATKDSLLREQEQLQTQLGKQREIYGALLGKNMALKKLESSLPSLSVFKPHVAPLFWEASSEEPQQSASERQVPNYGVGNSYVDEGGREQPQCTSSSGASAQALTFRFDLNCIPDGDL